MTMLDPCPHCGGDLRLELGISSDIYVRMLICGNCLKVIERSTKRGSMACTCGAKLPRAILNVRCSCGLVWCVRCGEIMHEYYRGDARRRWRCMRCEGTREEGER